MMMMMMMMILLCLLVWRSTVSNYSSGGFRMSNLGMAVVMTLASHTLPGQSKSYFLEFLSHSRLWVALKLVIVQMFRCIQVNSGTFHRYRCYQVGVGRDQLARTLVAF